MEYLFKLAFLYVSVEVCFYLLIEIPMFIRFENARKIKAKRKLELCMKK